VGDVAIVFQNSGGSWRIHVGWGNGIGIVSVDTTNLKNPLRSSLIKISTSKLRRRTYEGTRESPDSERRDQNPL
jgi:hypothetical protein